MSLWLGEILKNTVSREILIFIGIFALSNIIGYACLGPIGAIYSAFLCFPFYLCVRFIIWAIKIKRLIVCVLGLFSLFLLLSFLSSPSAIPFIPWFGTVVDRQTGQPIENAVIIRSWNATTLNPFVPIIFLTLEEKLSDTNGKFNIFKKTFHPSIPFLFTVYENSPFIYKPGYKSTFLNKHSPVVYLERVPTIPEVRKSEAEKTRNQYVFYFDAATTLSQIVENENDFIENGMERPLPPQTLILSDPPPQLHPADQGDLYGGSFFKPGAFAEGGGSFGSGPGESNHDSQEKKAIASLGIENLLELLKGKDCMAKSAACAALGNKTAPEVVQALVEVLKNDPCGDVTKSAADALTKSGVLMDPQLQAAWQSESKTFRSEAAWIIGQKQDQSFEEQLIQMVLNDNDTMVVRRATEALIKIGRKKGLPTKQLISALKDSNPAIRLRAAAVLGNMQSQAAIESLLNIIKTDIDNSVKETAAESIVKIGSPAVVPLFDASQSENDQLNKTCSRILDELLDRKDLEATIYRLRYTDEARLVITSLVWHKAVWAIEYLGERLLDRHSGLQEYAAWAISQFGAEGLDVLLEAMNSDYSETRRNAARALGKIKDPRAVEALITALQDESPIVQRTSAWALGEMKDERAVQPLISALQGEKAVRKRICEAMVKIGEPAVIPLISFIQGNALSGKQEAVWVLGALRDSRAIAPIVSILKKSTNLELRGEAVFALGELKDPCALSLSPLIDALVGETDLGLTAALDMAIESVCADTKIPLNTAYNDRNLERLISILKNNKDATIQKSAVKALGNLKDPRSTDILLYVLKKEPQYIFHGPKEQTSLKTENVLGVEAALALGKIKDQKSVEPLIALLRDPNAASTAASALGYIKDQRAAEPLIALLNDPKASGAAAAALGEIKDPRSVEPLIAFLNNPAQKGRNRNTAIRALGKLGDKRAIEAIMRELKSEDQYTVECAANALAKLDNQSSEEALIANLKDASPVIRGNTILALEKVQTNRSVAPLINILQHDDNVEVRKKAARSLAKLKDPQAIDALAFSLSNDDNAEVKRASESALKNIGGIKLLDIYKKPLESLIAALNDTSAKGRNSAAYYLGERSDPRSTAALVKGLKDNDPEVRYSASNALGKLKDPSSILPLIGIWSNGTAKDKKHSSDALAVMGPVAVEYLVPLLKHSSASIRWKAAVTLGNIKDASAVEPLIASLKDKAPEVRWAAAWALGMIGDTRAAAALVNMLDEKDLGLKRQAKVAIASINERQD